MAGVAVFKVDSVISQIRSGLKNIHGRVMAKIGDGKAPCAGNTGCIFKRGNTVSADFRP